MPELPEVETTRRGIAPHLIGSRALSVCVRKRQLRWPIPEQLETELPGLVIDSITRRGKYLILHTIKGSVIIHLGMSGVLRLVSVNEPPQKHDHVDIRFNNHKVLRYTDPRRFGCILWCYDNPHQHPLLRDLGPEPLTESFSTRHLFKASRGKKVAVKQFIMNSKVVVGVGNIYANEALFLAGIHPRRAAGRISAQRYSALTQCIKDVLLIAIQQGGTTLKDFVGADGKPGYFKQSLAVYGRSGQPCIKCHQKIKEIRLGQRSTYYCSNCQK